MRAAGRSRHAKRLMAVALREPTENALAQAEWASANGLNFLQWVDNFYDKNWQPKLESVFVELGLDEFRAAEW